jgi:hypothetical protein
MPDESRPHSHIRTIYLIRLVLYPSKLSLRSDFPAKISDFTELDTVGNSIQVMTL